MSHARSEPSPNGLMHRWFVQYNPLYLLSAALVLVGVNMLSSALAGESFLAAQLGVPLVAEVYGWALIGGAALLMRIDLRRPAVMLSMLAALYQCDVTLHTVSSVYMGAVGLLAGVLWLVGFVAKLHALAWAMQLRMSRSAWLVPTLGAAGLVLVPQALRRWGATPGSVMACAWSFALTTSALWSRREIFSRAALDRWGQTVLRRARRLLWAVWATALTFHAVYWCAELGLSWAVFVPVFMVSAARFLHRDTALLGALGGGLVLSGLVVPGRTAELSAMMTAVLLLRAWRQPRVVEEPTATSGPYRATSAGAAAPRLRIELVAPTRGAQARLISAAAVAGYISLWTIGWTGGALPPHALWLDGLFTLAAAMWVRRRRDYRVLLPLAGLHVHHGVALGLLALPVTLLGWGLLSVGAGFALLLGLLALTYRLRTHEGTGL